jgi:hypothetical protein
MRATRQAACPTTPTRRPPAPLPATEQAPPPTLLAGPTRPAPAPARRDDQGTATGDLTMAERQPPLWEKRAKHWQSLRGVAGRLRVAGDTLTFSPQAIELGAKNVAIRLADIQAFEVEPVNLGRFFSGGGRKQLAVVTRDGQRELFVVNNLDKAIDELRVLVRQHGQS